MAAPAGELESLQALERTIGSALDEIRKLDELASSASAAQALQAGMCAPATATATPRVERLATPRRSADRAAFCAQ